MFMYLAYKGIRSCVKHGHDTVFRVAYFGYFLVGTGSFMFHTTLRYPWQLFDELNMIYTTCLMVYVGLSYRKTPSTQVTLAVGLVAFCIFVTAYYHYLQDPTFHQNVYAALTVFIVFKSIYDMEYTLRPSLRKTRESDRVLKQRYCLPVPTKEQQKYENERDIDILKDMWILVDGYRRLLLYCLGHMAETRTELKSGAVQAELAAPLQLARNRQDGKHFERTRQWP
jgi:dihydroceramidase